MRFANEVEIRKSWKYIIYRYNIFCRLSDLYNLLQNEAAEQGEFADYRKLVKPGKKGDIFNLVSLVSFLTDNSQNIGPRYSLSDDCMSMKL